MKVLEGRDAEVMLLSIPGFTIATLMLVNVVIFLVKKLTKVRKEVTKPQSSGFTFQLLARVLVVMQIKARLALCFECLNVCIK